MFMSKVYYYDAKPSTGDQFLSKLSDLMCLTEYTTKDNDVAQKCFISGFESSSCQLPCMYLHVFTLKLI